MPTPPPDPVREPTTEIEREDRAEAMFFVNKLLEGFHNYTYSSRSHVPGGNDCTQFFGYLDAVRKWAEERPDWTLEIVRRARAAKPKVNAEGQAEWAKFLTNEEVALATGPSVELCRTIAALRMKLQNASRALDETNHKIGLNLPDTHQEIRKINMTLRTGDVWL